MNGQRKYNRVMRTSFRLLVFLVWILGVSSDYRNDFHDDPRPSVVTCNAGPSSLLQSGIVQQRSFEVDLIVDLKNGSLESRVVQSICKNFMKLNGERNFTISIQLTLVLV